MGGTHPRNETCSHLFALFSIISLTLCLHPWIGCFQILAPEFSEPWLPAFPGWKVLVLNWLLCLLLWGRVGGAGPDPPIPTIQGHGSMTFTFNGKYPNTLCGDKDDLKIVCYLYVDSVVLSCYKVERRRSSLVIIMAQWHRHFIIAWEAYRQSEPSSVACPNLHPCRCVEHNGHWPV